MTDKKIKVGIFLIIGIFLLSFVSAYTYSSTANSFNYNYGTDVGFKYFDEKMCKAGQDFIIQVSPFGCEPSVVRSDLLEEQNVPVFCQLAATKINPLIDVKAIDYISFQGTYPKEVSGVGFHPAQAAIKTSSSTLLNSPVLNNIGYAVIVLRQQKNESAMPDWVEGTLTANIRYDIKNAFGIGKATYYLPEIPDDEWKQKMNQYSFWEGKGFLRVKGIGTDSATVSVYEDEFDKIGTFNLEKGQTSDMTYLPGYYCMAGVQVRLENVENPNTRVKLKINDDIVEVAEGERFLDNNCQIKEIENRGIIQSAKITCRTDEDSETFWLKTSPRVKLQIGNEEPKDYEVGDWLYKTADNLKSVYVGYIGTSGDSSNLGDLYIYTIAITEHKEEGLDEDDISAVANHDRRMRSSSATGVSIADTILTGLKQTSTVLIQGAKFVATGEDITFVQYNKVETVGGKTIKVVDFAGAINADFSNSNLNNAMKDYSEIIGKYSGEKQTSDDTQTFGEKALFEKIKLAYNTEQKKTMVDLCDEFEEKYPQSKLGFGEFCDDKSKASSSEISVRDVSIDGIVRTISFEKITEPTLEEYGAEIKIEGNYKGSVILGKNQIYYLKEEGEYIQLLDLSEDSAKVEINVKSSSIREAAGKLVSSKKETLEKNTAKSFGGGYVFTLTKVNLEKVAKVSVIPNIKYAGTETNFSFKIGIEKRAIQLSPEKINEKLNYLNETITKWEDANEKLGTLVSGMKGACVATGTYLTVKNFFKNLGGKATARQEVMSTEGGWYDFCKTEKEAGKYSSVDACLLAKNDEIEKDVDAVSQIMESQETITKDNVESRLAEIKKELGNLDENVAASLTKEGYEEGKVTLTQAKDLERLQTIIASSSASSELKAAATKEKNKILADIKANAQNYALYNSLQEEMKNSGIDLGVGAYGDKDSVQGEYSGKTILASQVPGANLAEKDDKGNVINYPAQVITYNNKKYLVILSGAGSTYIIEKVFEYKGVSGNTIQIGDEDKIISTKFSKFTKYDADSYQNVYKNPEVRYFETAPYKGYPAIVPVVVKEGWYAVTEQIVSGGLRAYDDSGRIAYFYLCNVGENGRADGTGSDKCAGFDVSTGEIKSEFPGLDLSKTKELVRKARDAINEAQRSYEKAKNQKDISILGQKVNVGEPAADSSAMKCQDFMSPKDCWMLFNVCDPVICPSSRCDLGGNYAVKDVVQSGIVGSIALCLPNYAEKIYIPVCLTGIHAGIESLLSVYTNYRDCLQESLDTGQTVGICDEINSLYGCEFFWRQAAPISKALVPMLLNKISGQEGTRGGGEYLNLMDAYNTAGKSVNYMVQYYGANAYDSFNARSTDEVGTEVCKNFVSARYPSGGEFIDSLLEPDSPSQYSAWFSEIPFTTSTVPPISQYKVFYHIYAGKDRGAYYHVYLKSPSGTSFYYDNPTRTVTTGYIAVGDYASETREFTAPAGYQELCVNVNGQDECGFAQVSTDFAVNYVSDLYVKDQASRIDITTEEECISGSSSLYGFTTSLNVEEGANRVLNSDISSLGIVRVCATDNPGKATDVNWINNQSRWKDVGYCGNEKLKCWIDTESVEAVVEATNIEDEILGEVAKDYVEKLKAEGYLVLTKEEKDSLDKLSEDYNGIIKKITNEYIAKFILNNEKAYLLLTRGMAFGELARGEYDKQIRDKEEKINEIVSLLEKNPKKTDSELIKLDYTKEQIKEARKRFSNKVSTTSSQEISETKISTSTNCQEAIGQRIIKIASEIKETENIDDEIVKKDTEAKSFECLVLQLAMQESSLRHCKNAGEDCLYCEGNLDKVLGGDEGESKGIMQINTGIHKNVDVSNFEKNVRYGINLLISNYNPSSKSYGCLGKNYEGWTRALRNYNGWNTDCSKGDVNYVEKVLAKKDTISSFFPEECGSDSSVVVEEETIEEIEEEEESESGLKTIKLKKGKEVSIDKDGITLELENANEQPNTNGGYYLYVSIKKNGEAQTCNTRNFWFDQYRLVIKGTIDPLSIKQNIWFRCEELPTLYIKLADYDDSTKEFIFEVDYSEVEKNEKPTEETDETDEYEEEETIKETGEKEEYNEEEITEEETTEVKNVLAKWTFIISEAKKRSGKYSDNKEFIDELYTNKFLTTKEYKEINGEGVWNIEEDMSYVRDLLEEKRLDFVISEAKKRTGMYSDNKEFIDALYEFGLLTTKEYKEINGEGVWNIEEDMEWVRELLESKKKLTNGDLSTGEEEDKTIEIEKINNVVLGDLLGWEKLSESKKQAILQYYLDTTPSFKDEDKEWGDIDYESYVGAWIKSEFSKGLSIYKDETVDYFKNINVILSPVIGEVGGEAGNYKGGELTLFL